MASISVIVPVYNGERTIIQTIHSLQRQTFADFEIIVVNDGSTDNTIRVLSTIADSRLQIFSCENNGPSTARNVGMAKSTAEFISFIDADDLWTEDKLELQLQALQHNRQAGVAYSWTCRIDDRGKILCALPGHSFSGDVYSHLLIANFVASGSNILLRREAAHNVGQFDQQLSDAEDWDYFLRLAAKWSFVVVPKYQIFYRQSAFAHTANIANVEKHIVVIHNAFARAPEHLQKLKSQALAEFYRHLGTLYLHQSHQRRKVWQSLQQIFCLYPQAILRKSYRWLLVKAIILSLLPKSLFSLFLHRYQQFITRKIHKRLPKLDKELKCIFAQQED